MTVRVPRDFPAVPRASRHHIGRPYTSSLAASHVDVIAHLGGMQLSHVAECLFGSTEATSGTWRLLVYAGLNTRAVAVCIVPYGFVGSGDFGTIAVTGAEGVDSRQVRREASTVADLTELANPNPFRYVVPVTAGALNEISIVVTDVQLHSLTAYEVPRGDLTGTEKFLDRTIADANDYFTDNVGSSQRGVTHLVNMPTYLRTLGNRHLLNLPHRPGTLLAASGYALGSAAANDGPRIVCRDVRGGGTTTQVVRAKIRVDAIGAGTWTAVYHLPGGSDCTIVGINATGWWPRAGGEFVDPGALGSAAFADRVKVELTRTAGAGSITTDSFHLREAA